MKIMPNTDADGCCPKFTQLCRGGWTLTNIFYADKAGSAGGLRAMTLFSIFALRGRDRDNPSLRGRSSENYEQRMELIVGGIPAR